MCPLSAEIPITPRKQQTRVSAATVVEMVLMFTCGCDANREKIRESSGTKVTPLAVAGLQLGSPCLTDYSHNRGPQTEVLPSRPSLGTFARSDLFRGELVY